jgi:Dyp-type peroxidase family
MSTTTPKLKPTLNVENIQGDILSGLPKKYETFVFFDIANANQFRQKLKDVIPLITTAAQVLLDLDAIAAKQAKGDKSLIKLAGTNIAFSHTGLVALGIDPTTLGDQLFTDGQLKDSTAANGLGDPVVPGSTEPAWDPSFKQPIDGCILITGDSLLTLAEREARLDKIFGVCVKKLFTVKGHVRSGAEKGHEHFGFQDGLSQPPIIGYNSPHTGEVSSRPGVILLGEDGDKVTRPPWAKDSSFLVFRKLQQFVPEFNDFLALNPVPDKGLSPAQGSELLGARLVGRWKSGAPIGLDPIQDVPADGSNLDRVNDFTYADDPNQVKCPFTAHLRKMNPRAGNPQINPDVMQARRIMRQGIPYGPEVAEDEKDAALTLYDRGLLFVCYQSTLNLGFHFLQKIWANNVNFPNTGNGFDPIIGQNNNAPRSTAGTDPQKVTTSLALPGQAFVVPQGGEYFLSPSISALKTQFAAA